jgi:hypothetical protein
MLLWRNIRQIRKPRITITSVIGKGARIPYCRALSEFSGPGPENEFGDPLHGLGGDGQLLPEPGSQDNCTDSHSRAGRTDTQ